jgi:hypothetical protein
MKKMSLLFAVLFSGALAYAQNEPQMTTPMSEAVRFGLKAGVNLASLEIDDDENNPGVNTNSKTSFNAGVFVNLPLGGSFHVQPEILYSAQGTKAGRFSYPNVSELNGVNEFDFHYVTVPVMLQWWTAKHGLFLELGPQFGYLSSANADRENTAGGDAGEINLKDMDYVKHTDFAGAAGIGYLSRVGLGLNARYVHGFTNVWDSDQSNSVLKDIEYRNRVVQISLIYHFGASK